MNFKKFYEDYLKKIQAYQLAINTISFEQYTIAPKDGLMYSNEMLSILSKELFELKNNEKIILKIQEYYQELDDCDEKKEIGLRLKEIEETKSIPSDEYKEFIECTGKAALAWHKAKERNDYELFKPYLKEVVERKIHLMTYSPRYTGKNTYDLLLDQYEKGMNQEKYDMFFDKIKSQLVPLIKKVRESQYQIHDEILHRNFEIERQIQFMDKIAVFLKMDKNKVYLGTTEHPFTSSFSANDARITTHYYENSFLSAILSTVHEYGHALYGLQVNSEYEGTMFYEPYMAAHESQSRFLENHIGRSLAFWKANYHELISLFPELKKINVNELVEMINISKCSLIRTEADELTYPLHVLIRYEIEKEMVNQTIDYNELPRIWADKYEQYLGVRPKTFSEGVLQDVHWSDASIGYFPSYALGSAYAAQLYHTMEKELNIEELLKNNQFDVISNWLKEKVHHYGAYKSMEDIIHEVTHESFNPDYYIQYLTVKYTKLYKI